MATSVNFVSDRIAVLTVGISVILIGMAGMFVVLGYVAPSSGLALFLGGVGSWLLIASIDVARSGRRPFQAPPMYYAIWGILFLGSAFISLNIGTPGIAVASIFAVIMLIGMILVARVLFSRRQAA